MYMERNFENSVFLELRSYKGFIFNPMRLYEIFYDEKSERRTVAIENILTKASIYFFVEQAKDFGNGFYKTDAFKSVYYLNSDLQDKLLKLQNCFKNVINELSASYNENNPYESYVYATVVVSIILAMPEYFDEETIFKFVHFCRKNAILKI